MQTRNKEKYDANLALAEEHLELWVVHQVYSFILKSEPNVRMLIYNLGEFVVVDAEREVYKGTNLKSAVNIYNAI